MARLHFIIDTEMPDDLSAFMDDCPFASSIRTIRADDYRKVFVTQVHNEDDVGMVVYSTVAATKELAEADAIESIRSWGDYALPGEEGSIFLLDTQELNLIEEA